MATSRAGYRLGKQMVRSQRVQRFSTSNSQAQSGGGPGAAPFLLTAALIGPPAYVVFKMRSDAAFKSDVERQFPFVVKYLEPLVSGGSLGASSDGVNWSSVKAQVADLERRASVANLLVEQVTFSADEVAAMKAKVKAADELAQKKAQQELLAYYAEVKTQIADLEKRYVAAEIEQGKRERDEEKARQASIPSLKEAVASQKNEQVSMARSALNLLKRSYRAVFSSGSSDVNAKIGEAERAMNKDLETVLAQDLVHLDLDGLRRRVVQLTLELKDRNRWEALRLHELSRVQQEELARKYDQLLKEQEEKYEQLIVLEAKNATEKAVDELSLKADERLHKVMLEKEKQWVSQTQDRLEQQKDRLRQEMDKRIADSTARVEKQALAEQEKRLGELQNANAQIQALEELFAKQKQAELSSRKVKSIVLALFSLIDHKDQSSPLKGQIQTLERAGKGDAVIEAVVEQFPKRAIESGVPSVSELKQQFSSVKQDCQRAALVPSDGGIFQNFLGTVATKLKLEEKGLVEGDDVDACVARAQFYMDKNDLASAVAELDRLDAPIKSAASEWLQLARDRVMVDKSILLVKAHLNTLAAET